MLARFLRNESPLTKDVALLILRLGVGCVMLFAHGLGKLQGYAENSANFPDPLGVGNTLSMALAISAEVFCSVLLILGALTRLAAIPLIITMTMAHFVIHAADEWGKRESSFMYLLIYLAIFLLGPGRFSVDGVLVKQPIQKL